MQTTLERLHEWKGNVEWYSGFRRGRTLFDPDSQNRIIQNQRAFLEYNTDPNQHCKSFITGFQAGMKQARLERLLTNG